MAEFRSIWTDWAPGLISGESSESEPAKPAKAPARDPFAGSAGTEIGKLPKNQVRESHMPAPTTPPRRPEYVALALSEFVERLGGEAWAWVAEHSPNLFRAIRDVDDELDAFEQRGDPRYGARLDHLCSLLQEAAAAWESR